MRPERRPPGRPEQRVPGAARRVAGGTGARRGTVPRLRGYAASGAAAARSALRLAVAAHRRWRVLRTFAGRWRSALRPGRRLHAVLDRLWRRLLGVAAVVLLGGGMLGSVGARAVVLPASLAAVALVVIALPLGLLTYFEESA
jgi:hypothetical protein